MPLLTAAGLLVALSVVVGVGRCDVLGALALVVGSGSPWSLLALALNRDGTGQAMLTALTIWACWGCIVAMWWTSVVALLLVVAVPSVAATSASSSSVPAWLSSSVTGGLCELSAGIIGLAHCVFGFSASLVFSSTFWLAVWSSLCLQHLMGNGEWYSVQTVIFV